MKIPRKKEEEEEEEESTVAPRIKVANGRCVCFF